MRSSTGRASATGPTNSTARYAAPSEPTARTTSRATSLAPTPVGITPARTTLMLSGTRSHTFPVRKAPARSADPIPVAKAPTAPQVTVWLSAPTTRSPGLTRPVSSATWKLIPPPTGRSSTPCSAAKASMRAWNPRVEGEVGGE